MAGSSVLSPVDHKGFVNGRCCVSERSRRRKGCFTRSSASISLNPNPWCRAIGMCPVERTGLSVIGRRYVFLHCLLFCIIYILSLLCRLSDFGLTERLLCRLPPSQCPITCGGGVRSRTVTCALAPGKTCDVLSKPRSRSLCALQSCPNSSLRRRPGPAPKYRRIYPPKSHPTPNPGAPWAPTTSVVATDAATADSPNAPFTVRKENQETTIAFTTTTMSLSTPTNPHNVDADFELNVVRINEDERVVPSKVNSAGNDRKATDVEKVDEREEGEDGSTPNVVMYTLGYDYVVEERTTEEQGIIDLDIPRHQTHTKYTSLKKPTPQIAITPILQTNPPTMQTTKAPTAAYPTPDTSTQTWAGSTHRYPSSNPHRTLRINPNSLQKLRVPLTTAMYRSVPPAASIRPTQAPPSTRAWTLFPNVASSRSTVTIVKLKKPAVTPNKNNPSPRAKKPSSKGSHSKGQNQQAESPMSSSISDQRNLRAREPISMDVFWVVGNWSEVRKDIL